jgi:hypothetical protein
MQAAMFGPCRISLVSSDGPRLELEMYDQTKNNPNTVYVTYCHMTARVRFGAGM